MKAIIGYFAVVLATVAVAGTTKLDFAYFLIGFELILFAAAWLDSIFLRKRLRCWIALPAEQAGKASDFAVDVVLENRSRLPMTEISVELLCRDTFTGETSGLTGSATLDSGETARLHFTLQGEHCGGWDMSLGSIALADHLGLLRQTILPQTERKRLYLLPERSGEQIAEGGSSAASGEEENDGSRLQRTDEGSDYELRSFQRGDGMRQIHWKMAAKTDELMVRNFEEPIHRLRSLIVEPVPAEGETVTHEMWDRYLEQLDELSAGLLASGGQYYAVWCEKKTGFSRRILVEDEESRRWMLCGVMAVPDEEGLGFGEWKEDGLAQTTEQETLRLRWSDVAENTRRQPG